MRGRKPKPTETHKRNGNPGRRKRNTSEPAAGGAPAKPHDLTEVGAAFWDHALACFEKMGILDLADGPEIELMCIHYSKIKTYQETLEAEGHFVTNTDEAGNKFIKAHPAIIQLNSSTRILRSMLSDFGMNPVARVHLGTKEESENEFDQLLKAVTKN